MKVEIPVYPHNTVVLKVYSAGQSCSSMRRSQTEPTTLKPSHEFSSAIMKFLELLPWSPALFLLLVCFSHCSQLT